jgi:hypothetical protein
MTTAAGGGRSDGTRTTRLFIDEIADGVARVLMAEEVLAVPVGLLPAGVREGDWVQMDVGIIDPPSSDAEARRRRLAKDDPGGPLKL